MSIQMTKEQLQEFKKLWEEMDNLSNELLKMHEKLQQLNKLIKKGDKKNE